MTAPDHKGPPYHIGALARLSGFSAHTIRWYESQGLLPNVPRDRGGRRVYQQVHVEYLAFIVHLRHTRMPVADLRRLTELGLQGWRSLPNRRAMLVAHRARVEKELKRLTQALDLIDEKLEYYAVGGAKKAAAAPSLWRGRAPINYARRHLSYKAE